MPIWEFHAFPLLLQPSLVLGPGGTATAVTAVVRNSTISPQQDLLYTRLGGVPAVWPPPYCQAAPQANLGYSQPRPDSLLCYDFSQPGARYAQLVRWRWQVGTPGTPGYRVVLRDSAAPAPLRLGFGAGQVPPVGTPLTLTVTNNLGCTSTQVYYPFGAPLGTRAASGTRALRVFPNPAGAGQPALTVQWPGLRPGQPPVAGEVLNTVGQVVRRVSWPAAAMGGAGAELIVAGLPPGLYVLRLRSGAGSATQRLVLE